MIRNVRIWADASVRLAGLKPGSERDIGGSPTPD